jgi:hypothetical protein
LRDRIASLETGRFARLRLAEAIQAGESHGGKPI